ncbi:MAG: penicillin-binding protein 2 [Elusimicrobiota bacterium]|jgi:cell division protein FtsI/penicillin-binding protein 2|nr:penicillin-binding protein 2 [Elusimicrobiota bacterium]
MPKKQREKISRLALIYLFFFAIFFILIARLVYVQIICYPKISKRVNRMVLKEEEVRGQRGAILDVSGRPLAVSERNYSVFLDPSQIKDFAGIKKTLAVYGINIKENNPKNFKSSAYVPIAANLSEQAVEQIREQKFAGLGFESHYTRRHPQGFILMPTLGLLGSAEHGLSGIEFSFDKYLLGKLTKVDQTRDGAGRTISREIINPENVSGKDVRLTIDVNIQFIVEQELKSAFARNGAKHAVCIVQDPYTGRILAMASLPDFSPNTKITDISMLRNYAVSGVFEPGSTFKIVAIAAALNEGIISADDYFAVDGGRLKIDGYEISDDPVHKMSKYENLSTIMAYSSNVGLVRIGQKLGKKMFYRYIRKFGFYSLSAIDLPGEERGTLPDARDWGALTFANISFGQAMYATAIQITNAYSAIANGGILMKPVIIESIDGKQYKRFAARQVRRVITEQTAREVRKLLRGVVDFGTGKSAKVSGYSVAGKTGTGQKYDASIKQYSKQKYTSSFAGMIPAENPKVVIFVMFDEPRGDYYAASIAAPVFKRIAERTARYLNIAKDD